jgi:MoxR-like ATPase
MNEESNSRQDFAAELDQFADFFARLSTELRKFYQEDAPAYQKGIGWPGKNLGFVDKVLIAFFAGGHVLLEGIPGLGKTELVNAMVKVLGWTDQYSQRYKEGHFGARRIQCTPDLMPLDIIGGEDIFADQVTGRMTRAFKPGPIFTHLLLVDEINRATPKTQSALLQGMAELKVTYGTQIIPLGVICDMNGKLAPALSDKKDDCLFFVIATQNPIEQQGTYPLPEAQLDRFFFKLITPMPGIHKLKDILKITTTARPPELRPVLEAPPHEIAQKVVGFRKLIKSVSIDEKALHKIGILVASTWPGSEDLPLAEKIYGDYLKAADEIEKKDKDFKKKRSELQQKINKYVQIGIGPRGAQTLLLALKVLAALQQKTEINTWFMDENFGLLLKEAWRHRLMRNYDAENEKLTTDMLLDETAKLTWIN